MKKIGSIFIGVLLLAAVHLPGIAYSENLSEADVAHLIFMRSEEKLARDVYLTLAKMYPKTRIFYRIADTGEQPHTDQILIKLEKFNIPDPEPKTAYNTLPPDDQIGVFENPYFKAYFEEKYGELTAWAGKSLLDALMVGAFIEELDMVDILYCNDIFYTAYSDDLPDYPDCGGLSTTRIRSIERTLSSLLEGSENHLCSFLSQIVPLLEPDCYSAQYLPSEELKDIISDQCPQLLNSICGE